MVKLYNYVKRQKCHIQNLSSLIFVNFAVAGIGFITQLKIANIIGKESFGMIAYGMAIATYGAVFIRFGLEKTLVRDLIQSPDHFTTTVKASLLLRFTLLGVFLAIIFVWKLIIAPQSDLSWGVLLIVIANSAMSVDLQAVYDSWHKMTRHSLYNLLQRGLYFAVIWTILLIAPENLSVFSVGVTTLFTVTVYLVLQYSYAIKHMPKEWGPPRYTRQAIDLGRSNFTVWLAALLSLSFGPLNQLVLKHYHGAAELGGYAAAWLMVTLATLLFTQVARIGNPATAKTIAGSPTKRQKSLFLLKYTLVMLSISLPLALFAIVAPQFILEMLFHSEYVVAAPALQVMGIYLPVFSIGLVAGQYVLAARMEKAFFYSILVGATISILMCPVVIPSSGAVGAAWILLISHGASFVGHSFFVIRDVLKSPA